MKLVRSSVVGMFLGVTSAIAGDPAPAVSPSPSPAPAKKVYKMSTVGVGGGATGGTRARTDNLHVPAGLAIGVTEEGDMIATQYPDQNMQVNSDQKTTSGAIQLQARDYRLKIPAANGVLTETDIKVGTGLTTEKLASSLKVQNLNSQYEQCTKETFETKSFKTDGNVSVLKGYKFGNHVFVYALAGGNADVRVDKRLKSDLYEKGSLERWVYVGAVVESGVGFQKNGTTTMVGPTVQVGKHSSSNELNFVEGGDGNLALKAVGLKGRVTNDHLNAQGAVTYGTLTGPQTPNAGNFVTDSKLKTEFIKFGCEVMVKVSPQLAVGGTVTGQFTNTKDISYEDYRGSGSSMVSDVKSKDASIGGKVIWVIPNGPKKAGAAV